MSKAAVFGGTSEGRRLAQLLAGCGVLVYVFVATEYGEDMIDPAENLVVSTGRLDTAQMAERLKSEGFDVVVDTTHPYAHVVTDNLRNACEQTGTEYIRLHRASAAEGNIRLVADATEAATVLDTLPGNVLLTVGSKELAKFTKVRNYQNRLFARVLPSTDVVAACAGLGFRGRNLICIQGPFTREMNTAMLQMFDCSIMVTKDSGREGGMPEKLAAAADCGAKVILINRPEDSPGLPFEKVVEELSRRFGLSTPAEGPVSAPRFPMFVPLDGRPVLVVGGGPIAARRVSTLLGFGAKITVVSPQLCPQMEKMLENILWCEQLYSGIDGQYSLVVAATDNRQVNQQVGADSTSAKIPVSVADRREESTFWFPAAIHKNNLVAGVVSTNGDHAAVKSAAAKIRNSLGGTY